jgi:hypothetical protein
MSEQGAERQRPPVWPFVVVFWACMWGYTYSGALGYDQRSPTLSELRGIECGDQMAAEGFFSLFPPIWIYAFVSDGAYRYGHQWSCQVE